MTVKSFLCLTTSYPEPALPSAGRFVACLNQAFLEGGWSPKVIGFQRGQQCEDEHYKRLDKELSTSSSVTRIPLSQSWQSGIPDGAQVSWWRSISLALSTFKLNQVYHQRYQDCSTHPPVIAHWALPCGWIARAQQPIIYCHGGDVALLERLPIGGYLATYLSERAQRVICVSRQLQQRWINLLDHRRAPTLSKKVLTLPMGIETPSPCPVAKSRFLKLTAGFCVLATVGRLVPIKGFALLCEALGSLPKEIREKVIWLAAGEGEERDQLAHNASHLGVNLILLGELLPQERDALLDIADLFIAPSIQIGRRVEGAPLALREAALSGCQLVTTTLGGVNELIQQLPQGGVYSVLPTVEDLRDQLIAWWQTYSRDCSSTQARFISEAAHRAWSWSELGPRHLAILDTCSEEWLRFR